MPPSTWSKLSLTARHSFTRFLVFGHAEAIGDLFSTYSTQYDKCLIVSEANWQGRDAVKKKKLRHHLGQSIDLLVLDFRDGFDANVLGIGVGLVNGGGAIFLIVAEGFPCSPFEQHIATALRTNSNCYDLHNASINRLTLPSFVAYSDQRGCRSREQTQAVDAIKRVVTGHTKRPLVLSADRGRGKSAATGIALAELLLERDLDVIITAPQRSSVDAMIMMFEQRLVVQGKQNRWVFRNSTISYVAPDALLDSLPMADVVIVDEAAAIPISILLALSKHYRRMVFATTTHGYEGSGQGFLLKFIPALKRLYSGSKQFVIENPIRWAKDCPVERFLFDALLLDAAVDNDISSSNTIRYRQLDKALLNNDLQLKRQLFGLLIQAHYQTAPSDLQQLLDDPLMQVFVSEIDGRVVGCCLTVTEGGFPANLAELVTAGKRRLKGNLLPQSLALHCGHPEALQQTSLRIMRIAVADTQRRKGIASALLEFVIAQSQQDYIGTSFGCTAALLQFWTRVGFVPLRLGVSRDAASGTHSMLMARETEIRTIGLWFEAIRRQFADAFPRQCLEQFSLLDVDLVKAIFSQLPLKQVSPDRDVYLLKRYANGGMGYDVMVGVLTHWLIQQCHLDSEQQDWEFNSMLQKCLLNQSWNKLCNDYSVVSHKQLEQCWRSWLLDKLTMI
ncbi:GNAT family N-acetyltransferase [Thaumasiovibrio sp. DFM-14]|uniref:GNAT family N-acetyltransferase n=1 Tax=Thaumasiovibrio sp. DFM-14 TaxID=3384792 RepID=UPI0039A19A62